jgi:hypothetical protein
MSLPHEAPTEQSLPRRRPSAAEPVALPAIDYWRQSRQPLTSLAFVVPLLAIYEIGVLGLGRQAARNGVDVWLRSFLDLLDIGQYFLLPVVTVGILLGWHYTQRLPWRLQRTVLLGMGVECLLLAICLRIVLQLELAMWLTFRGAGGGAQSGLIPHGAVGTLGGMIGFLGAGVYEELLFRLILLSAIIYALTRSGFSLRDGRIVGVLVTSALFSAAHYVGVSGEAVATGAWTFWFGAVFRFLAGVFFSVLFVFRGFGIAVGSHAAYNVLVKIL